MYTVQKTCFYMQNAKQRNEKYTALSRNEIDVNEEGRS